MCVYGCLCLCIALPVSIAGGIGAANYYIAASLSELRFYNRTRSSPMIHASLYKPETPVYRSYCLCVLRGSLISFQTLKSLLVVSTQEDNRASGKYQGSTLEQ